MPAKNAGLGFRSCSCGKAMRGMRLDDPQSYFAQTINIVDIESQTLDAWRKNQKFELFLAGASLELSGHSRDHITTLASRKEQSDPAQLAMERALRASLAKSGLSSELIDQAVADMAAASGGDAWITYNDEITRFENLFLSAEYAKHRQTIEYVFVRDDPQCASLSLFDLERHSESAGDVTAATRYRAEIGMAELLGIRRLELIQELPLTLGCYGYSRYLNDPYAVTKDSKGEQSRATLRPFDLVDGKIPIYTAKNTTEALLFEVDPVILAAFLSVNLAVELPDFDYGDVPAWKAWLIKTCPQLFGRGEAHLELFDTEVARGIELSLPDALVFGAVHSLSHALKMTAHKFVGIDGDGLAEYLFPAYGAGLIYASANVKFTLGGIDSVFRSNLTQWLGAARDYAGLCSFDPVCSEDGGACHACMYPKFGCQCFNRTVSRSFLVGGLVDGLNTPILGLWSREVREALESRKSPVIANGVRT